MGGQRRAAHGRARRRRRRMRAPQVQLALYVQCGRCPGCWQAGGGRLRNVRSIPISRPGRDGFSLAGYRGRRLPRLPLRSVSVVARPAMLSRAHALASLPSPTSAPAEPAQRSRHDRRRHAPGRSVWRTMPARTGASGRSMRGVAAASAAGSGVAAGAARRASISASVCCQCSAVTAAAAPSPPPGRPAAAAPVPASRRATGAASFRGSYSSTAPPADRRSAGCARR